MSDALPSLLTVRAAGDMTRGGGPRRALYNSLGIDVSSVCVVDQVHSTTVLVVQGFSYAATELGERLVGTGDGLLSPPGENLLAMTVADCMPIHLYDRGSGAFGLLHSGWKGTGILGHAIDTMVEHFGTAMDDLSVTFGPCISAAAYQVDEERGRAYCQEWGPEAVRRDGNAWYLDMRSANVVLAERAGVRDITVVEACTYSDRRLGSYRREGPENFGRMLTIAGPALARMGIGAWREK